MKTFTINTLGCKVNQYESQQIRQLLESHGLSATDLSQSPDLVVINTCCVTHTASSKSRQSIRKVQKLNPNAAIVVAGCLPIAQTDEFKNINDNTIIVGQKNLLASTISYIINSSLECRTVFNYIRTQNSQKIKQKNRFYHNESLFNLPILTSYSGQCRAFLKVQDGCDGYCSYCIIPKIRTKVCNKSVKSVLQEAHNLVQAGHKEIVLTGIFLGAYGQNTVRRIHWESQKRDSLADLIDKVAQVPGLERIRLSSLEPADVTDRLLDVFSKNDNIMPHLHLPLQSGSERILKKMCRQYNLEHFQKTISNIRLHMDRPAITTDIIVGFPDETDTDFDQTFEFAKEIAFSKIHVFSFSPRKNTPAASMPNQIKPKIIKERSLQLRELDKKLQEDFRKQFIGEKVSVIVEESNPLRGRCEKYFMVELDHTGKAEKGDIVTLTLNK